MKRLRICLAWLSLVAVTAHAHRLNLTWEVVGTNVVVKAETDGVPAAGAMVECLTDADEVWAGGALDDQGRYAMGIPAASGLTVSVNAGLGHRRSLTLSADQLELNRAGAAKPDGNATAVEITDGSRPASGSADAGFSTLPRVLVGFALLLAAAAAWMSYQNSRRLAALEDRFKSDAR